MKYERHLPAVLEGCIRDERCRSLIGVYAGTLPGMWLAVAQLSCFLVATLRDDENGGCKSASNLRYLGVEYDQCGCSGACIEKV